MPADPVIDIPRLLQPISDDSPSGEELNSLSPSLDAVKTLFQDSRTSERELREREITGAEDADDLPAIDPPRWAELKEKAVDLLSNESKDLRVVSWLIEALLREDGFAGLRDGLALFEQMSVTFWDTIHPAPTDEDGHYDTVAQFDGFASEATVIPLFQAPITNSSDGEQFNSIHFVDAAELETVTDVSVREDRMQAGAITFEALENAVRNTDSQFYVDLVSDLRTISESLSRISSFLDDNCRPNDANEYTSPSVSFFRGKVNDIIDNVLSVARFHLDEPEEEGPDESGQLIAAGGSGQRMSNAAVVSRDDAFEVLRKVADFFERTEPHSPVPYALRQVVTWGKMSLPDLLKELINDSSVLRDIGKRIGIDPPEDE